MAIEFDVTEAAHVFRGEDKTLQLEIFTDDTQTAALDVSGFALSWVLRKHDLHPTALVSKSTVAPAGITIAGVFNANPQVNTQKVQISLLDTDTYDPPAIPAVNIKPGTYRHSLKREDIGAKTVLMFGDFTILGATAP